MACRAETSRTISERYGHPSYRVQATDGYHTFDLHPAFWADVWCLNCLRHVIGERSLMYGCVFVPGDWRIMNTPTGAAPLCSACTASALSGYEP